MDRTEPNKEDKLFDLSPDALNDHLRVMARTAGVKPTGQIKWNILRKFLFSDILSRSKSLSIKTIPINYFFRFA